MPANVMDKRSTNVVKILAMAARYGQTLNTNVLLILAMAACYGQTFNTNVLLILAMGAVNGSSDRTLFLQTDKMFYNRFLLRHHCYTREPSTEGLGFCWTIMIDNLRSN